MDGDRTSQPVEPRPSPLVRGWRLIQLDSVGSTNHEARRRAHDGALGRTVIVAREQMTGRGRDGRTWHSPPGNLYLSALLRPEIPAGRIPELSFVAALAVSDAVSALLPPPQAASLKWPNDVLLNGAKVSGILIETAAAAVIMGIGVNVAYHPPDLPYAATSLREHGSGAGVDETRDAVLEALSGRLRQWELEGFVAIRTDWLSRAHQPGTLLRAGHPPVEGRFVGLDGDGALLLDTPAGRRRFVSGDISPA